MILGLNMGDLMYCPTCGQNRITTVKINWIIAVILLLLGILFGVIYIAYCFMEKAQCPVCETSAKLMEPPHHDKMQ